MAAPEIKLPQEPSDLENHAFNPDIEKDESEKRPQDDSGSSGEDPDTIGADDEITFHDLTFETELPSPAYLTRSPTTLDTTRVPPPACPDLKIYTSPFLWSPKRKRLLTWMSVCATTITAYSAGSYTSTISQLTALWHISDIAALVGVTLFTVGFAVAPMFLAPFSEINGRRPMFVVTGVLLVLFQLVCAVTPTFAGMLIARFLVGCAGSTFSTMVGGVVSDIYHAEDRNTAMSLFSGAALLGTGLGPVVSGFIAQNTTWRWVFYLQVITCGTVMVFIVFFFNETRGSVLLSRKAKAVNQWYEQLESQDCYGMMMPTASDATLRAPQRIRWKVKSDEERVSIGKMIAISLYRPFHLLVTEPVVFFFSVWVSFAWGILYLLFSAIPLVFQNNHGFSLEGTDAVFAAICIGAILSTIIAIYQEPLARRYIGDKRRASLDTPEGRLYFACVQSSLLPIGCFWFAWTSFPSNHWIVPALAVGCATMGIFSIYLAVFNYLADTYGKYASSALAAQSFCRNMFGGAFPLFTKQMFTKMTYQGAGSFLGAFSALLTIVPWVLIFYGPRIRARSKIASEMMRESK
ncbi:hypothetical protein LTR91_007720 [Friedmanniomyces endolithicus]|uniref:Major facilitator superfamily (MFS) profile domain-containing protein n=1 Tax=Friedmanniomyces endolithicus TaxID=329885 RepID=A0AAN6QVN2_9PEZI|nr:hypothetical protein LTR57_013492 [Friedmanniomyces endolithicus]KAK0973794.1 hypothetical protein LTS01_014429 [Friedmanniomyces endolithicus]KAK0994347.1 hypothetical protein LTR91_007720 [Friedmanniomyces endolithicus]KAK1039598.1 hypothetical protein LTS16_011077 [Friedmanniomyces endolithicus]